MIDDHLKKTQAGTSYRFWTPVYELELQSKPSRAFLTAFYTIGIAISLALLYAYAFVLPAYIGFETTVLVGIAAIALGGSS